MDIFGYHFGAFAVVQMIAACSWLYACLVARDYGRDIIAARNVPPHDAFDDM